jgi:hypothetical protein
MREAATGSIRLFSLGMGSGPGVAMQVKTHCLLVTDDAFVSLDLAEGLAEVFSNVEVTMLASFEEALAQLPVLPKFALALLDDRRATPGRAGLPEALLAQGSCVALLGTSIDIATKERLKVLDWPFGYDSLRAFLIRLRPAVLGGSA